MAEPAPARRRAIWFYAFAMVLIVQFLFGMVVNLWTQIPDAHPGAKDPNFWTGSNLVVNWALAKGGIALSGHILIASALIIGAVVMIVIGVRRHAPDALWAFAATTAFFLGAAFSGAGFLMYNTNAWSMSMASFFAAAMLAMATGVFLIARSAATS